MAMRLTYPPKQWLIPIVQGVYYVGNYDSAQLYEILHKFFLLVKKMKWY